MSIIVSIIYHAQLKVNISRGEHGAFQFVSSAADSFGKYHFSAFSALIPFLQR